MAKLVLPLIIHALHGQIKAAKFVYTRPYGVQTVQTHTVPPKPLPQPVPPEVQSCPCQAFKYCDLLYQQMTPEERDEWRRAVKRPVTSPYDLWMRECLTLVNAGEAPPDHPSASGGFSGAEAEPGTEHPGLEICGWIPPTRYDCTGAAGDPPWQCIEVPDGEFETLEDCQAECEAPPPPPCPPCAGEFTPIFKFWLPGDWPDDRDRYTWGCVEHLTCLPDPQWISPLRPGLGLAQYDGYGDLHVQVEGEYGSWFYSYHAGGNDCESQRDFVFDASWGTGPPPVPDPTTTITLIPAEECPIGPP